MEGRGRKSREEMRFRVLLLRKREGGEGIRKRRKEGRGGEKICFLRACSLCSGVCMYGELRNNLLSEGDSLTEIHLGHKFSTRDQDNDAMPTSCAQEYKGAWWYNRCHHSNLNGLYLAGENDQPAVGVNWYHWKGPYYSLRFTEMKIRPF